MPPENRVSRPKNTGPGGLGWPRSESTATMCPGLFTQWKGSLGEDATEASLGNGVLVKLYRRTDHPATAFSQGVMGHAPPVAGAALLFLAQNERLVVGWGIRRGALISSSSFTLFLFSSPLPDALLPIMELGYPRARLSSLSFSPLVLTSSLNVHVSTHLRSPAAVPVL